MKIALLSTHSPGNAELARLTEQNRWDYSARHGYDLITLRMSYEESFDRGLLKLAHALQEYDVVFAIGSDVVITNPHVQIEAIARLARTGTVALMSREMAGRSAVNNDVAIWLQANRAAEAVIGRIRAARHIWEVMPNLWQSFIADTPAMLERVTVLEPRALCATDQGGEWLWEPGDFVCHLLGGTTESKIERCKAVLEKL